MNHVITRPTKAALRRQAERSIQFDAFVTYEADGDKDPSEWLLPGYQGHHIDNGLPVPLYDELTVLFAKDWGVPENKPHQRPAFTAAFLSRNTWLGQR
jgi:hypothetical protein